jgi:queuine tRNA-ribosyltransferase
MTNFTIEASCGKARAGRFKTHHGDFQTPQFMPVGTKASVKGVDCERLLEIGTQITLVNTYHLWLRPGPELIKRLGGIHKFCNFHGPILSDSGGYQVFSLKGLRKISEEGVEFRSHLDGAKMFLSPENAIEIQETFGVDIAMVLDECPSSGLSHEATSKSLELTLRWAKRCLQARKRVETQIFGITQGALYPDLRRQAAEELSQLSFDGMAIGGLSVGELPEAMYEVLNYHVDQLPSDKIHYLMGVGTPRDIVQGVYEGIDTFDCVMPTRAGRFGRAFVKGPEPYINIKNSRFVEEQEPLSADCSCLACRNYSRAYICHLFRVGEMLGPQLLSIHNLAHYLDLMRGIRNAIIAGNYEQFYQNEKSRWSGFEVKVSNEGA